MFGVQFHGDLKKEEIKLVAVKVPWTPQKSVWANRRNECESHGYLDSDDLLNAAFAADWQQLVAGVQFSNWLSELGLEGPEFTEEVRKNFRLFSGFHEYYTAISCTQGTGVTTSGFAQFVEDACLVNESSPACSEQSFHGLFSAVQKGNEKSLPRAGWIHLMCRIAVLKFQHVVREPFNVVAIFCSELKRSIAGTDHRALFDRNKWRMERLYCRELDKAVKRAVDGLRVSETEEKRLR